MKAIGTICLTNLIGLSAMAKLSPYNEKDSARFLSIYNSLKDKSII